MAEMEREITAKDFDLEITDLDQNERPPRRRRPRLTPGQRKLSLALTAALFALVIVVILASSGDVRALLTRTLFPPRPTVPANNLAFYVQGNPSWGRFIIDGRPVAHLPVEGHDRPLTLTPGRHTIVWQVAPFEEQRCVFSVVDATTINGPCLLNGEVTVNFVPNAQAMILSFFVSMNVLPAAQRAALLQQLQTALASYGGSEQVRPGELYAVSEQEIAANPSLCHLIAHLAVCYARANQPLQATLSAQLNSNASSTDSCVLSEICLSNHQDCRALCSDYMGITEVNEIQETGWNVMAVIRLSWSYATLSGKVIARDQPASALRGTDEDRTVNVHIAYDSGGWHVTFFPQIRGNGFDDPICDQAAQDIYGLAGAAQGNQQLFVSQTVNMQTNPASGCLAVVQTSPGTYISPATPVSRMNAQLTGYCLVRFGVMLMVDQQAHQFWPDLPSVDAYENGLAKEMLASQSNSS